MNNTLLLVDDQPSNLRLLGEVLRKDYELSFATSGEEAMELAEKVSPDLVLLDIMMPGIDGYTVCNLLKKQDDTKHIPVIFVTTIDEEGKESEGFRLGAVDYIIKPIRPAVVKARVKTHLSLVRAQHDLKNQNAVLEKKIKKRTIELIKTKKEIIQRLGLAAEYRDPETGGHINRMSHYSAIIAQTANCSEADCDLLLLASPMHDLGKVGIPDNILLKPGKLDAKEWETMKTHSKIGADILTGGESELMQLARTICMDHHEKWSGAGYPQRLKEEEISIWGRITAIADVFDALTSIRPYKEPWPIEKAVNLIKEESGKHFDPFLVECFFEALPEILKIREKFPD